MTAATDITETAARFAESIMTLPPLPATAQEILACFGDEFIDAEKVAEVVEGDPGICAKLLGLSNSAYFGLAEPVNDIGEAISRVLGVDTVRSLVLAMAIQQSFDSKGCPDFEAKRFWMTSLMAAECCKKIASADGSADDTERDLAYSAGLCHNLGLMALTHIEPVRTCRVLRAHREQGQPDSLAGLLNQEFGTDHKIMTAELGRIWSLPQPMVAAYQYRAFPKTPCDERLGLVVAAGITAVENEELDENRRSSLAPWSETLGIAAEDMQGMAAFGDRQKDRVQSRAGNMTR
jgi:HD-like signal output (HDOD) protein